MESTMAKINANFNPNINYMVQNIHYDILSAIAENVLDELYSEIQNFPEMMVCDWRAYAILEAYRQYSYLFDATIIPPIDECFSGEAVPPKVRLSNVWSALTELHELHWQRYMDGEDPDIYDALLNLDSLPLANYTLVL